MAVTMKKTLYYNFFPTKDEEIKVTKAGSAKKHISCDLIEIRELEDQPRFKPKDPWHIRKVVEASEIETGILHLSWHDTLDHIFRYWDVETANLVTRGKKIFVGVDLSDPNRPIKPYQGENIYLQKKQNGEYVYDFGLKDMVVDKHFKAGDLIGLTWDCRYGLFQTKVLSKGNAARAAIVLEYVCAWNSVHTLPQLVSVCLFDVLSAVLKS